MLHLTLLAGLLCLLADDKMASKVPVSKKCASDLWHTVAQLNCNFAVLLSASTGTC